MTPDFGLHYDVPYFDYEQWEAIRKTHLWQAVRKTMLHYKYSVDHPKTKSRDAMLLGNAGHMATTDPFEFSRVFVVQPEMYTADRGKDAGKSKPWSNNAIVCKQWHKEARERGQIVLTPAQRTDALGMARSIRGHGYAEKILADAKFEVSMLWKDEKTGLVCKGRWDIWKPPLAADIKSTREVAVGAFGRQAYSLGYHFQAAMYRAGAKALGLEVKNYQIIAVENSAPYSVKLYQMEEENWLLGDMQYRTALDCVAQCLKHKEWPAYQESPVALPIPSWAGTEAPDENIPWEADDDND